jgi:phosphatidylglycerophosphatase A
MTHPRTSFPLTLFVTWFYIGKLPKMPGTWGSLVALPMAWFLHDQIALSAAIIICLFFLSWIAIARYLKNFSNNQDPQEIVIDEVIGQWITLLSAPQSIEWFIAGFLFFRFFDIIKPFPVSWADNLRGSRSINALGVLLDDVFAGLMALGVLQGLLYGLA